MYCSSDWQLLEARIDADAPFEDDPDDADIDRRVQYLWGECRGRFRVRYLDDLVMHRVDGNTDGDYDDVGSDAKWYHLTDAQFSTVAVMGANGDLHERVSYDPYGKARHHLLADVDGDGDSDLDDRNSIDTGRSIGSAYYNVDADFDRDGDVDMTDFLTAVAGSGAALPAGRISSSDVGSTIGWDGYVFNAETAEYTVRHRHYNTELGRWLERDPLSVPSSTAAKPRISRVYRDGMNLYGYAREQPISRRDPHGLASCMDTCVSGCPETYFPCGNNPGIPDKYVRTHSHYDDGAICRGPSLSCVQGCKTMCSEPSDSCKPKGSVSWGAPTTSPGSSGFSLAIQVVGEDPNCCSKFGVVQFAKYTISPYGSSGWGIDDGRIGGSSNPSPAAPFYGDPVAIRNPGGRGTFIFADQPCSGYNRFWEFKIVVMCTAGPAAGHIYGMYMWSVGTGLIGGVWSPPTGAPLLPGAVPYKLPSILKDRCCGEDT